MRFGRLSHVSRLSPDVLFCATTRVWYGHPQNIFKCTFLANSHSSRSGYAVRGHMFELIISASKGIAMHFRPTVLDGLKQYK